MPVKVRPLVSRSGNSVRATPTGLCHRSTINTPGMIGRSGKCPTKKGSLTVTFLMATMRLAQELIWITRSSRSKG